MGARHRGRLLAFFALFEWEFSSTELPTLLRFEWLSERERYPRESEDFARLIVSGTLEKIEMVDREIKLQLEHWDFSRLAKVDLSILRMGVYSLLYQREIPSSVSIDEAVEIAKEYGTDDSYRFINGVLDGVRKRLVETEDGETE